MATVRPAGGASRRRNGSPHRAGRGPGEDPKDKEEREKAESKRAAFGARPGVDAAGNTTVVLWSYFNDVDNVVQASVREAGKTSAAPVAGLRVG